MGHTGMSQGQEAVVILFLLQNWPNCKPLAWPATIMRKQAQTPLPRTAREPIANNYKSGKKSKQENQPSTQTK